MSTLARSRDNAETLLFDKLPHGALVIDGSGNVVMANRKAGDTFQNLAGRRPRPGDALQDFLLEPRPMLMADIRAVAGSGRLGLWIARGRPALRLRVTAVQPHGPYILAVSDASSAISRLRNQLRDANSVASRERRLRQQAEVAYSDMENFSTIAAHDLKQPLRNIADLLSFLVEDFSNDLPADALALVETARSSASRLQALIGDLLRHSRIGSEPMETQTVAISEVVAEIAADFAPQLEETGGRIQYDDSLGSVQAVPQLFRLLLENLIGNALKYRAPERQPVIVLRRSEDRGTLEVRDNGRGFDPEEAKKMFEPFTRLVSDPRIEGTGIGLASCRTIALRHGWSIYAEGRPGRGATFVIEGLS